MIALHLVPTGTDVALGQRVLCGQCVLVSGAVGGVSGVRVRAAGCGGAVLGVMRRGR